MHNLLKRLLEKRNIEDIDKLESSEKATYDNWQKILSTGNISIDKVKEFCDNQIRLIHTQWRNLDNTSEKNNRLIIQHTVYSTLLSLINSPNTERENLEKYLNQLIEQ